mgnify:CR=1 FL=1
MADKTSMIEKINSLGPPIPGISKMRNKDIKIILDARLESKQRGGTEEHVRNQNKGGYVKKYANGGSIRMTKLSNY